MGSKKVRGKTTKSKSTSSAQEPPSDSVLMRHIRLLKPHLAKTGFRTAKWDKVAAGVNKELGGTKVFGSGRAAQRRFGVLRAKYEDEEDMSPILARRMGEYIVLLDAQNEDGGAAGAATAATTATRGSEPTRMPAHESDDNEDDVVEDMQDHDQHHGDTRDAHGYADGGGDVHDEHVEEIEFGVKQEHEDADDAGAFAVDLTNDTTGRPMPAPPAFAMRRMPLSREEMLLQQVDAQQQMMQSLLGVIQRDRDARRDEFREILRLATRK